MSDDPDSRVTRIEIAPRTIGLVLLAGAAIWLAVELWTVIVIIVVALVLVGTFDPLVTWFERRGVRRGRALLLIFFVMAGLLAAILRLSLPPLIDQLVQIIENVPKDRTHLINWLSDYRWASSLVSWLRAHPVDKLTTDAVASLSAPVAYVLSAIGYGVTTIFLAMYLLAEPKRANGVLYAVVPRHHHMKLARILIELESIVGGYMRGQLITSLSISVFMFVMLTAFGVDDALAIAIFAGMTDIIPFVGGIVASAPAVFAVSSHGGVSMIIVAILCFLYQEFENRILVPRVYGRQLRLAPAIVMLSLLVGGTLLGVLGALLALPIAAGLQMIVRELRVELPGEQQADAVTRAQDEKADHIYEVLTQDSTAAEASVIAGELAQEMKRNEAAGGMLTTAEMPVLIDMMKAENEAETAEPAPPVPSTPTPKP